MMTLIRIKDHIQSTWLRWILIGFLVVIGGCDCGDSGGDTTDPESAHALGDVWAMSYPTNIALQLADHTFIQALDSDGNSYSYTCFGNRTDGEMLADTLTQSDADITVVEYMASERPCKWPLEYYLRIGVCHQCANRALYYTGKTVANARGYEFFAAIYGTYGDESQASYQQYSMTNCLNSAPDWQGAPYLPDSMEINHSRQMPEPINKEVSLYQRHRSDQWEKEPGFSNSADFESYLATLFRMQIKARLGAQFPQKSIHNLLNTQKTFRKLKRDLDRDLVGHAMTSKTAMDRYTSLFNKLAMAYKTYLTPREYEQLFNLDFHEPIDLSGLIPRSPEMDAVEP